MQSTLAVDDPLALALVRPPAGWPPVAANESGDNDVTSQDTVDDEAAVAHRRELHALVEQAGKIERPKHEAGVALLLVHEPA